MNLHGLLLLLFLFCLAGLILLQRRRLHRDLQSLERLTHALEQEDEAPATAPEWLTEGYASAGVIRIESGEVGDRWNLYLHARLPVIGLQHPPTAVIRLYSFVADSGVLLTTNLADREGRLLGLARQEVRLVQLRPTGSLGALHGQHRGTVQAWLHAGRSFEPVARSDVPVLIRRELGRLAEDLRRQPAGWLALLLAGISGRFPRLLRF